MSWLFKPSPATSCVSSREQHQQRSVGVKEDMSAIGETIGRQLRGVATFLAPPPVSQSVETEMQPEKGGTSPSSKALVGIRNDLAEIGGSLKSGLSKFTSSFMQFPSNVKKEDEEEDGEDYVPGVSDEVIHFVDELSTRQEFWTDFPLPLQNDFRMSDEQRQHVSAISEIVPRIATLKASLHSFMGGNQFWLIYFILLLPRLNEEDTEILASRQIVETRNLLLQNIKNKNSDELSVSDGPSTSGVSKDVRDGTESRYLTSSSLQEPEITEIAAATKGLDIEEQDATEQWLEDTDADTSTSGNDRKKFELVEETSFSDLEADDSDLSQRLSAANRAHIPRTISAAGSTDWIQFQDSYMPDSGLNKTRQSFSRDKDSDIESTEWLKVDDFD